MRITEEYTRYVEEWENKINAFIELNMREGDAPAGGVSAIPAEAAALIGGLPFAVKDNIAVKDMAFTCGSKHLEKVRSPYTAAAVQKLEAESCVVIGKTNLDEFGMGFSTDNSAFKKTVNPWDTAAVVDGAAAAVAAGMVPFALATDAGGSARLPAASCGITGLKPTYGAVSRYGLAAYASALETAGIFADTAARCRAVFAAIKGRDTRDQSSHDAPSAAPSLYPAAVDTPKRIGVISPEAVAASFSAAAKNSSGAEAAVLEEAARACALDEIQNHAFQTARQRLAALGHTLVDVEIPYLIYSVPAFYAIAAADASGNLARFDSIRFGARPQTAENPDDLMDRARETGFGKEAKLQALLGTFVLRSGFQDRYYLRAHRIRAGIQAGFEAMLGGRDYKKPAALDAILMPVTPQTRPAGDFSASVITGKAAALYNCCVSLAGLPSVTVPVSADNGVPAGVQLTGRAFAEATLLDIAESYGQRHPLPHPRGFRTFWNQE